MSTSLLWLRQDLRLTDQPALHAALAEGSVVPVFVLDDDAAGTWKIGSAQRWWLHHSLIALRKSFEKRGAPLILRRGDTVDALRQIADMVGAARVHAVRHYEPWHKSLEARVGEALDLQLHEGNYLAPPDMIRNGSGGRYRVFTPWYRKLGEQLDIVPVLPPPDTIHAPSKLPESDDIDKWHLRPTNPDWATGFSDWAPGEKGAWRRWREFQPRLASYASARNLAAAPGTSRLSPHLHFGEISPRALWNALADETGAGPSVYRSELAWRDHGINLLDQIPNYPDENGRQAFNRFAWRDGLEADRDFTAWTKGRTGYPLVDAGMRELWQTGWMHNRVRMVTASFLVKHLLIDWRRGERWFWDTLLDADAGSNAMNWQYVTGTGVDAPVFSRIMAPHLQSEKFDMADYVRQFVPELAAVPDAQIHALHLGGPPVANYPSRLVGHEAARARALAEWHALERD